jgi:hypothetical protein
MIRRADFPITLVFPPQGDFTLPHFAIPCLAAWLIREGQGEQPPSGPE